MNTDKKADVSAGNLADKVKESSHEMAKKIPVLGHVVWLYNQSSMHKHYFIQEIDTRILPPLMRAQFKLYMQSKSGGLPMAYISWAFLSDEAEERYMATQRIAPRDWASGNNVWLIDMLTPFGGNKAILKELQLKLLQDKTIHTLYPGDDGVLEKKSLQDLAATFADKEPVKTAAAPNASELNKTTKH